MKLISSLIAAASLAWAPSTFAQTEAENQDRQTKVTTVKTGSALESVCHLWIRRKVMLGLFSRKYTGSAVLYQGRYLLTAGHNVYQDRSNVAGIEVRCGATNARTTPVHEFVEGWQTLDAERYSGRGFTRDFGVIRLNTPIRVSNPFTLAADVKAGEAVRFAGYPGVKYDGWTLFAADAALNAPAASLVSYDLTTYKSNSGGPVWREMDGKPELVAIHVTNSAGRVVDEEYRMEVNRLIGVLDQRAALRGAD